MRSWANNGRNHSAICTRTSLTFTSLPAKVHQIHQSSGEGAFCTWLTFSLARNGGLNGDLFISMHKAASVSKKNLPCPSFPWSFRKYQGKPQKHQGFLSPHEPLKTLENKQKTPKKTKDFRSKKNTKETKTPRKRRTRLLCSWCPTRERLAILFRATPPIAR